MWFHKLHSIFPTINYCRIKLFFKELGENYKLVKKFLMLNFKNEYRKEFENKINILNNQYEFKSNLNNGKTEILYQDLVGYSNTQLKEKFLQLRSEILNNQKVYCKTSEYINNLPNKKSNEYQNLKKSSLFNIRNMQSKSIEIILQIWKNNNYKKIDLHGLFLQEAEEVIENIDYYIKTGSIILNDLEIITGRGKNSANNKGILFPNIRDYLQSKGYKVKIKNKGSFIINS